MLSLSQLYCDKNEIFPSISFKNGINVVYASVTKNLSEANSHSLGKSLLAELIDYMLLKQAKKEFFLKRSDAFLTFNFYLEIKVSDNVFITIRRSIASKIDLFVSDKKSNVLISGATPEYSNLGLDKAKSLLSSKINLDAVTSAGGHFRTGLRYCIRRQEEFINIFKSRNHNEKDKEWKPYLGGLLGINANLLSEKYELVDKVNKLKSAINELDGLSKTSASALEAEISTLNKQIKAMQAELDGFSFYKLDKDITQELVEGIGVDISNVNEEIYSLEQRLHDINESLASNYEFDLQHVKDIYESVKINLPEQLIKSYEELVALNIQMTEGRKEQLIKSKEKLTYKLTLANQKREQLSSRQEELSDILIEKESFKKYKLLQSKVSQKESHLAVLDERLAKIDTAAELKKFLHDAEAEEDAISQKISILGRQKNNSVLDDIVSRFSEIIKATVNIDSYFYFEFNKEGNPEYKVGMVDETTVDKGHSYTKLMAAALDVSLLTHYSERGYYRFAYHDGIYESLEDRVKLKLLSKWRELSESFGLQLIITVLDSDIPEGSDGQKVNFYPDEIIRELHDRGDDGRLFRMPKF